MPRSRRMSKNLIEGIIWLLIFSVGLSVASLEPGFLDFDNLPDTNFSCVGKVIGGYYADLETNCQMFHVCTIGQLDEPMDIRFLCLNGTVFDQETRVCERIDEVDCSKSEKFYSLNLELYGNTQPPTLEENVETESPSVEKATPSSTTTTTSPRPTTSKTTTRPIQYFSRATTQSPFHKGPSSHHFPIDQQHRPGYSPEEINISLNPNIRTKPFVDPHQYSDNVNSNNNKILVTTDRSVYDSEELDNQNHFSSTVENDFNNNAQSLRPSPNFNFNFHFGSSDSQDSDSRNHNYHYQSNIGTLRPSNRYSDNSYRPSTTRNEYLTRKNFDVNHQSSTGRSFYLQPIKSPSHHYFSKTEKPPGEQLPIPVLPTISPIVFSSPAPFSLSRRIENKRYTDEHELPPRIIISASASVSDANGRTLNYSLGTIGAAQILPQPPSSYDEYKEEDVVLDPFYHDVPKLPKKGSRTKREAGTDRINPLEVIKTEDEAIQVLKFLFDWYKNHETTPKTTTINIPVSPDVITNINEAFSEKPYISDYHTTPTSPSNQEIHEYLPTKSTKKKLNRGRHRFTNPFSTTPIAYSGSYYDDYADTQRYDIPNKRLNYDSHISPNDGNKHINIYKSNREINHEEKVDLQTSTVRLNKIDEEQTISRNITDVKSIKKSDEPEYSDLKYIDDELSREESKKTSNQLERFPILDTYDYVNDNFEPLTYTKGTVDKDEQLEKIGKTGIYEETNIDIDYYQKNNKTEENYVTETNINITTPDSLIESSNNFKYVDKNLNSFGAIVNSLRDFQKNEQNIYDYENNITEVVDYSSETTVDTETPFLYTSKPFSSIDEETSTVTSPTSYIPFGTESTETTPSNIVATETETTSIPTTTITTKTRSRGRNRFNTISVIQNEGTGFFITKPATYGTTKPTTYAVTTDFTTETVLQNETTEITEQPTTFETTTSVTLTEDNSAINATETTILESEATTENLPSSISLSINDLIESIEVSTKTTIPELPTTLLDDIKDRIQVIETTAKSNVVSTKETATTEIEQTTVTLTDTTTPTSTQTEVNTQINVSVQETNSSENEIKIKQNKNRRKNKKKSRKPSTRHRFSSATSTGYEQLPVTTSALSSTTESTPNSTPKIPQRNYIFNCFGKRLNNFYSDPRDCRLFHYCTVGYTKNQLLDMKFVCDLGTYFDDEKLVCTSEIPSRCT